MNINSTLLQSAPGTKLSISGDPMDLLILCRKCGSNFSLIDLILQIQSLAPMAVEYLRVDKIFTKLQESVPSMGFRKKVLHTMHMVFIKFVMMYKISRSDDRSLYTLP